MTGKVTIIIGEPAVGKSTIMYALLKRGDWRFDNTIKYIPCHWQTPNRCVLGRYDIPHPFPGTDRMSMACQPHVVRFILQNPEVNFVFEGDRLGNDKMIKSMQYVGVDLEVIQIYTTDEHLAKRRAQRNQSEKFLRSRKTKIERMIGETGRCFRTGQPVKRFPNHDVVDGTNIVDYLVEHRL